MMRENPDMDHVLDRAISEIRDEQIPDEVVETAAARVWSRLSEPVEHIRSCADFQALLPDFRARRLSEPRFMLVQDHLRECVNCRHVFEGKVVALPPRRAARESHPARWAVAAGIVIAGGLVGWFTVFHSGNVSGRAIVQSISGALYEVSASGIREMKTGEPLPDGLEIRTARDSGATLSLADGSLVEMRERSDFSTSQAGGEITAHLGRGSIIVQAAHRRSGHLYVATADCRVAVTGTLFSVSAGVKGSRVSVVEGEVHVTQGNDEHVLHRGDQVSTAESLEPVPVKEDLSWSRNAAWQRQLLALRSTLAEAHPPKLRYSSRLVGMLPASTIFFASIANLAEYLGEARSLFRQKADQNSDLRAWLAGPGASIDPVLEQLRAANEYLGEEIAIFSTDPSRPPVFLAEVKRDGFAEFLKRSGLPLTVEVRSGVALFSPSRDALGVALDSGFQHTSFYGRIVEAYRNGAGLLLCADLARLTPQRASSGIRYLIAGQQEVGNHLETRASLGFDGPPTGLATWLAAPSPMGALDYITPDATFVAAFAVSNPRAVLHEIRTMASLDDNAEVAAQFAASLGSELAIAMDGPPLPVPSWKLVAEMYEPDRFQGALEKFVAQYNRDAPANGSRLLRTGRETVDGRTYYVLGTADPNPLTEAHYTFANGYLVAAPSRALLVRALQAKTNGTAITRSPSFTALIPRDHYANFSAVVYQNFGTTLAPFAALLGPKAGNMVNMKPFLLTAYEEKDRIALGSTGDILGMSFNDLLTGGLLSITNNVVPWVRLGGTTGARSASR